MARRNVVSSTKRSEVCRRLNQTASASSNSSGCSKFFRAFTDLGATVARQGGMLRQTMPSCGVNRARCSDDASAALMTVSSSVASRGTARLAGGSARPCLPAPSSSSRFRRNSTRSFAMCSRAFWFRNSRSASCFCSSGFSCSRAHLRYACTVTQWSLRSPPPSSCRRLSEPPCVNTLPTSMAAAMVSAASVQSRRREYSKNLPICGCTGSAISSRPRRVSAPSSFSAPRVTSERLAASTVRLSGGSGARSSVASMSSKPSAFTCRQRVSTCVRCISGGWDSRNSSACCTDEYRAK
mmetsp:Transcript_3910/g.9846  ORF Transcript_3910/g.9846 Transcript_3910/m.9846 type:complete len:296 (-) Transcript_3910:283-1170(-)